MFHVPTGADEFGGEPVEEFGVGGGVALHAKVARRADEAGAEELLPETVHGDAGGERILRIDDPVGEIEAGGSRGSGGVER